MYEDNAKEPAQKTPEVENALNRLQRHLTQLEVTIEMLEPRLISIVKREELQPYTQEVQEEDCAPLAHELFALSERVSRANQVILSLHDRIEL